jgi:FkbM family methyltransferase
VPHEIKYGFGLRLRSARLPYSLLQAGSTVVQVGSPCDLLYAGRSRALYFATLVGESGRVLVIEPDNVNARLLREYCKKRGVGNVTVVPLGVWEYSGQVSFYINDSHPASNFVEGVKKYTEKRLKEFRCVKINVDTMDNILEKYSHQDSILISITTNGSEKNILKGMSKTIKTGLPYISLAKTPDNFEKYMENLGYTLLGYDDRGYTFCQNSIKSLSV